MSRFKIVGFVSGQNPTTRISMGTVLTVSPPSSGQNPTCCPSSSPMFSKNLWICLYTQDTLHVTPFWSWRSTCHVVAGKGSSQGWLLELDDVWCVLDSWMVNLWRIGSIMSSNKHDAGIPEVELKNHLNIRTVLDHSWDLNQPQNLLRVKSSSLLFTFNSAAKIS